MPYLTFQQFTLDQQQAATQAQPSEATALLPHPTAPETTNLFANLADNLSAAPTHPDKVLAKFFQAYLRALKASIEARNRSAQQAATPTAIQFLNECRIMIAWFQAKQTDANAAFEFTDGEQLTDLQLAPLS